MKKILLALAIAGSFTVPAVQAEFTAENHETCTVYESLAGRVVRARQSGVSMKDAMQIAIDTESTIAQSIIREAYSLPSFSTPEYQQEQEREFADKWYGNCYQAISQGN